MNIEEYKGRITEKKAQRLDRLDQENQEEVKNEMMEEFEKIIANERKKIIREAGVLILPKWDIADAVAFDTIRMSKGQHYPSEPSTSRTSPMVQGGEAVQPNTSAGIPGISLVPYDDDDELEATRSTKPNQSQLLEKIVKLENKLKESKDQSIGQQKDIVSSVLTHLNENVFSRLNSVHALYSLLFNDIEDEEGAFKPLQSWKEEAERVISTQVELICERINMDMLEDSMDKIISTGSFFGTFEREANKDFATMSKAKNTIGYMRLHPEEKLEELHGAPQRQGTRKNVDTSVSPSSYSLGFFNSLFDTPVKEEMQPHRKECTQVQYSEETRGQSRSRSHQSENCIDVPPPLGLTTNFSRGYESIREQDNVNLIDLDDTFGSEITIRDPKEFFGDIDTLGRELQEKIDLRSKREKEKESEVTRAMIERDGLIQILATLKALAQEKDKPSVDGPILREILDKKSKNITKEKTKSNMDNQKLVDLSQPDLSRKLSQIYNELETTRIENETLAKELKRVEMEALNAKMKRKIDFLKLSTLNSTSFIAGPSKTKAISDVISTTTPNVIVSIPTQNVYNT
ncbi:uncharacterized protein LOC131859520 [Cryptomeria japonica]|uniref:uncharacterized protein LOC131859520 n=1 Tax=Cryptomeria japonica TaxID=3369 RepID=UPI0027DA60EB|nr:uncharacterized protein LOC131859520 [Cryptomeria japonica]